MNNASESTESPAVPLTLEASLAVEHTSHLSSYQSKLKLVIKGLRSTLNRKVPEYFRMHISSRASPDPQNCCGPELQYFVLSSNLEIYSCS